MKDNKEISFSSWQYAVYWDDEGFYWPAHNRLAAEELLAKEKPGGILVVREIRKTYHEWAEVDSDTPTQ